MKNITYLIGAGASANAVPIVKNMVDNIKQFLEEFKKEEYCLSGDEKFKFQTTNSHQYKVSVEVKENYRKKLLCDLEWLIKEMRNRKCESVDDLAFKLYKSGEKVELKRLKIALSVYLIFRQMDPVDYRYDAFVKAIIEKPATREDHPILRKQIKIISWNYDHQFEKAYSIPFGYNDIMEIQSQLKVYSKHFNATYNTPNDCFSIYKINGTAGIIGQHPINREGKHYLSEVNSLFNVESIDKVINTYAMLKDAAENEFISTLSFAWGKDNSSENIIKKSIEGSKNTNVLIVIGYSFPISNSEIDIEIINAMTNLEQVYFQAPDAHNLKKRFLAIRNNIPDDKLITRSCIAQFLLPNEL